MKHDTDRQLIESSSKCKFLSANRGDKLMSETLAVALAKCERVSGCNTYSIISVAFGFQTKYSVCVTHQNIFTTHPFMNINKR